jgi:hypothetical protein
MPVAILKPGGRIVITDIRATALYEADLRALRRVQCGTSPTRLEILEG